MVNGLSNGLTDSPIKIVDHTDRKDTSVELFIKNMQRFSRWEQDALRRILVGTVDDRDIAELTILAKLESGIDEQSELLPVPPNESHVSAFTPVGKPLKLLALSKVRHVNALAPDQTIGFLPKGMTLIYGGNGTGKSGYSRILRNASRSRSYAPILNNIFSGEKKGKPEAELLIQEGDSKPTPIYWTESEKRPLEGFSVYDRNNEMHYIDKDDAVLYTPPILGVFSNLVKIVKDVRDAIQREADNTSIPKTLSSDSINNHPDSFNFINSIKEGSSVKHYQELINTSNKIEFNEHHNNALKQAELIASKDVESEIKTYELLYDDILLFIKSLKNGLSLLGSKNIRMIYSLYNRYNQQIEFIADTSRIDIDIDGELVPDLGTDVWKKLYFAAREFAETNPWNRISFPSTSDNSLCPLCFQPTNTPTVTDRFGSFKQYIDNKSQATLKEITQSINDNMLFISQYNIKVPDGTFYTRLSDTILDSDSIKKDINEIVKVINKRKSVVKDSYISRLPYNIPILDKKNLTGLINAKNKLIKHINKLKTLRDPENMRVIRSSISKI